MVITQEQKRSAASSNPLFNPSILQIVLSYVGPGHCLFVAPVSKWWFELYFKVESQQLTVHAGSNREKPSLAFHRSLCTAPCSDRLHESSLPT